MIITKKKDISGIIEKLSGKKTVWLFGCNSCAEQCQTGGQRELVAMAEELEKAGIKVVGTSLPDETCYKQIILKEYRTREGIKEAEAVLVLACGAGVKAVADSTDEAQPVFPALDSHFLASVERYGRFFEGCSLCGECVLGETGGICPHTDCPKGLLNGPCGGVADGRCEVNVENECAWVRIYERLKAQGRLDVLRRNKKPKDHSRGVRPRSFIVPRGPGNFGKGRIKSGQED